MPHADKLNAINLFFFIKNKDEAVARRREQSTIPGRGHRRINVINVINIVYFMMLLKMF